MNPEKKDLYTISWSQSYVVPVDTSFDEALLELQLADSNMSEANELINKIKAM
jgi:hypothetical protein